MFTKILIANRGEIACRIIQTAQRMGIATVAVFSEADRRAKHVALAQEAVLLGPPPSRESYLLGEKIIDAAVQTGAQAIHPGYGFLSENADFARQVERRGLVFIGPKHEAIAAMGDKIASKKLAQQLGVMTIPSFHKPISSAQEAVQIARDMGYPVIFKASAGGGGKGVRVAFNDRQSFEGFESCQNESFNSFGDDRILIEKFLEEVRHIEIQVLGDAYGNIVHLYERECSIQRRRQKIIEEAPSPFISEFTRQAMAQKAVTLARAVGYQSAGTVEFLVDMDQNFYFLEMNTRLQVEHPVTECITGLDLVEQMIRVAAGERLSFTQEEVQRIGWAVECRINAEDPQRDFLPTIGRLVNFQPPKGALLAGPPTPEGGGIRLDTGVREGDEIQAHYDSMIAKLVVHGTDRKDAVARMRDGLNAFNIRGISSNVAFLTALTAHPQFVNGDVHTDFVAHHFPQGFTPANVDHDDPLFLVALAVFAHQKEGQRSSPVKGQLSGYPFKANSDLVAVELSIPGPAAHHKVRINGFDASVAKGEVLVGERQFAIQSKFNWGDQVMIGTCNGKSYTAQVERCGVKDPLGIRVSHNGKQTELIVLQPRAAEMLHLMPPKVPPMIGCLVLSPMSGVLAQVLVAAGQKLVKGQRLAVIEAMKMENVLYADYDSQVAEVMARVGESLTVDQPIIRFEEPNQ